MAKQVMDRRASDNQYLHRDFHGSLNHGVDYVGKTYGDDGVKEYLSGFARSYHAPLIEAIRKEGLQAIEAYLTNIYALEEASEVLSLERENQALRVRIARCPAVSFLNNQGIPLSPWYVETSRTVWATIAAEAGLGFEWLAYDPDTGQAEYLFRLTT